MAMIDNLETLSEREEIEMLLPWYVTGKLERADRDRVEAYLARHPELRSQLGLIEDELDQTVRANEAITVPSARVADRLLSEIRGSASMRAADAWARFKAWAQNLLEAPSPAGLRWAAATAAVLILVQAVTIGALVMRGGETGYETASGRPAHAVEGTFVLVRFAGTAPAKAIADALSDLDMTIVDGPKAGLFRVRLGPKDMANDVRDQKIAALRQRGNLVLMVMPTQ
jgi:hypothetical protein